MHSKSNAGKSDSVTFDLECYFRAYKTNNSVGTFTNNAFSLSTKYI